MAQSAPAASFQPGERVPETGVYRVSHSTPHTGFKENVYEGGKKFPLCGTCFWSVRYVLVAHCTPQEMLSLHRGSGKVAK